MSNRVSGRLDSSRSIRPVKSALLVAGWGKGREKKDYIHPPLGLYRLQHSLVENGVRCEVFDPNLSSKPYTDLLKSAQTAKADLVGFSCNHYTIPFDMSLAHHLYRNMGSQCELVGGGIGCTESYGHVLNHAPPGFVVARGEGEETLPDLCVGGELERVAGLAWVKGGEIRLSEPRKPMTRKGFVDAITGIDWEGIPFEDYWGFILRFHDPSMLIEQNVNTIRLIVSSYCPRGCRFCSSTNIYKLAGCEGRPPVFRLSPSETLELIKRLIWAHPEVMNFFFHDDDFLWSSPWVKELCGLITDCQRDGSIPGYITFMAQGSVRNIPQVADSLAGANFKLIGLGVESFSPRVLQEFNKPQKPKQIHEAIDSLLKNDITPYVNLILSSPDSTAQDLVTTLMESIKLLRKGASVAASVYTLAFPGAEMTGPSEEEGLVTYQDFPIESTGTSIRMTDKILPRDPLLRGVLERSEAIQKELDREFFSGEGAFRSLLAPLTFHAIARSLEEAGVSIPDGIRKGIREYGIDFRKTGRVQRKGE